MAKSILQQLGLLLMPVLMLVLVLMPLLMLALMHLESRKAVCPSIRPIPMTRPAYVRTPVARSPAPSPVLLAELPNIAVPNVRLTIGRVTRNPAKDSCIRWAEITSTKLYAFIKIATGFKHFGTVISR